MRRTTPGELDSTNGGDFTISKVYILSLAIDDQLAHRNWQRPMMVLPLSLCGPKETDDTMRIKGIGGSTQATFGQTGFLRSFCWRDAKQSDGSNPFIQALFWVSAPLLEQVIVVSS